MKNIKEFLALSQSIELTKLKEFELLLEIGAFDDYIKPYKKLKICDDFIFSKVMIDKDICKEVIEILLGIEIGDITYLEEQKEMRNRRNSKSIKVDIVLKDGNTIYNVELQNANYGNLHKRVPHYFHTIANYFSSSGEDYLELSNIFVIFICNFDPFKDGLYKYTFNYTCNENKEIVLNDGSEIIFFNTKSSSKAESPKVEKLLDYFSGKYDKNNSIDIIDKMQTKVEQTLINEDWEEEYMKYTCDLHDRERIGVEKGIGIGVEKGISITNKKNYTDFAKKMLKKNYDINEIVEMTGFNISQIKEIAKENGIDIK